MTTTIGRSSGHLAGPDNRLVTNQSISVMRRVEDVYRQLRDRGLTPKQKQPPPRRAPRAAAQAAPASDVKLFHHRSVNTDGDGRFEALLGPGKYQVHYGNDPAEDVVLTIDGQSEHELNLHVAKPAYDDFVGRVIAEGSEKKSVPNAHVTTCYLSNDRPHSSLRHTANASGVFRIKRRPLEMLVYARDEDGLSAAMTRVTAEDSASIIVLRKAASAHGRLIDAADAPIRGAKIVCELVWDGRGTVDHFGGTCWTDERGEFTATGLVVGRKYHISRSGGGRPTKIFTVEPGVADRLELGDYRFGLSGQTKLIATGPVAPAGVAKIFPGEEDGQERLDRAQRQAKQEKKQILVVLEADWSAWCHRLVALFKEDEKIAAILRDHFVVVLADADDSLPDGPNSDLLKRYVQPNSHLPFLVVLDASGNQFTSERTENLEEDEHYDAEKLLRFLDGAKSGAAVNLAPRQFRRQP